MDQNDAAMAWPDASATNHPVRHLSAAREDPPRTNSCSHAIASQSPASDPEDLPR